MPTQTNFDDGPVPGYCPGTNAIQVKTWAYVGEDRPAPGDAVVWNRELGGFATPTSFDDNDNIVGVVTLWRVPSADQIQVLLAGTIYVRVFTRTGPIAFGDKLTWTTIGNAMSNEEVGDEQRGWEASHLYVSSRWKGHDIYNIDGRKVIARTGMSETVSSLYLPLQEAQEAVDELQEVVRWLQLPRIIARNTEEIGIDTEAVIPAQVIP